MEINGCIENTEGGSNDHSLIIGGKNPTEGITFIAVV